MSQQLESNNTVQTARSLSLAPGFSRVCGSHERSSRFNGFPLKAKTVETVFHSTTSDTRLKPGANESGIALPNAWPHRFYPFSVHQA
jgi:hypothetical protein